MVFAHSDFAEQPHLAHFLQYRLLVDLELFCLENDRDSAMTNSSFVFIGNRADSSLYFLVLVRLFCLIEVVIVCCSCHVRYIQEYGELVFLP